MGRDRLVICWEPEQDAASISYTCADPHNYPDPHNSNTAANQTQMQGLHVLKNHTLTHAENAFEST